jgi:hypothetical protein
MTAQVQCLNVSNLMSLNIQIYFNTYVTLQVSDNPGPSSGMHILHFLAVGMTNCNIIQPNPLLQLAYETNTRTDPKHDYLKTPQQWPFNQWQIKTNLAASSVWTIQHMIPTFSEYHCISLTTHSNLGTILIYQICIISHNKSILHRHKPKIIYLMYI